MFYKKNIDGGPQWDIPEVSTRKPGISAFVRLANEEEWVKPSIESILPWVDEVVCALQCSTDRTKDILLSINHPKISIFEYPFESWPNGPGHGKQPWNSVHNNSYFYNWNVAITRHEWVLKWDGDMVAMNWLGGTVQDIIDGLDNAAICMNGINLVGDCTHMSARQPVINERQPRLFKPGPETYYRTGAMTQVLNLPVGAKIINIEDPGYLHFKWAKNSCFQGWPENWHGIQHFSRISKRAIAGDPYNGEIPSALSGVL